jgi:hypothetical protein
MFPLFMMNTIGFPALCVYCELIMSSAASRLGVGMMAPFARPNETR